MTEYYPYIAYHAITLTRFSHYISASNKNMLHRLGCKEINNF